MALNPKSDPSLNHISAIETANEPKKRTFLSFLSILIPFSLFTIRNTNEKGQKACIF